MKKLFLAVAAVAMVFATSCKKENVNEPEVPAGDNEFICVIDQNANPQNAPAVEDGMGTMAHIDASNDVWWQAGDKIMYKGCVAGSSTASYYELTCSKMAGDGRAYFSDQTGNGYHFYQGAHEAYYPSSLYDKKDGYLKLPASIQLESDKNAGFLPMYGTGSGTHYLSFTNICAVLKIKIPASIQNCNKIIVSVGGQKYISGPFTMNGTKAELDITHRDASYFSTTITVNAPGNSFAADSYVYVAMPEGTYDGFKVTLYNGDQNLNNPTAKDDKTVEAGKIYPVTITPISTKIPADAFYFEAGANGATITLKNYNSCTTSPTLWYAREGDPDWSKDSVYTVDKSIRVAPGNKLYVIQKTSNVALATSSGNFYFDITDGTANIGGKLMYLMNSTADETGFTTQYAFKKLFYDRENLIGISDLVFPNTISANCFESTFEDCDNLTSNKIELKATQGQASCYYNMFKGCTSLVAKTLTIGLTAISAKSSICRSMFEGCSSLDPNSITLSAISCGSHCYRDMFKGCVAMNPSDITLPAETLATYCYYGMFEGCIALDRPVTIKAQTITYNGCMQQMFKNCSKLSSVYLPDCRSIKWSTTTTTAPLTQWLANAGTDSSVSSRTVYCINLPAVTDNLTSSRYLSTTNAGDASHTWAYSATYSGN